MVVTRRNQDRKHPYREKVLHEEMFSPRCKLPHGKSSRQNHIKHVSHPTKPIVQEIYDIKMVDVMNINKDETLEQSVHNFDSTIAREVPI
jgi:hypothetical protein